MEIIKCDMSHLNMVTDFYDRITLYLEQTVNFPKWTHGVYPAKESVKTAISSGAQYICLNGSNIIGAFVLNNDPGCNYDVGDWRVNLNAGEYLVIHTLAVDPNEHHKGTGKFLVDYCLNEAKSLGYKAVRVDTVPDNFPARKLYEKIGFLFAGEKDLMRGIDGIPKFALYEFIF